MAGDEFEERGARMVVQAAMAAFALLVGAGLDAVATWSVWTNWGPVPAVALCLFFWPIPAILTYWVGLAAFGRVVLATGVSRRAARPRRARVMPLRPPVAIAATAGLCALAVVAVGLGILALEVTEEERGPQEAPLIQDAEAVILQVGDAPIDFIEIEGSRRHVSNTDSCAGAVETEREECLSRLEEWGRLDGYEVEYAASDPQAFLGGTYRIFAAVSTYRDPKGTAEAFRVGRDRLQEQLRELPDAGLVEADTVGDESVAFVTSGSQELGGREVPVSLYVVDFRRGNVLARVGTAAPKALASVDDALSLAQRLDERILKAASKVSPTATPAATESPLPTP